MARAQVHNSCNLLARGNRKLSEITIVCQDNPALLDGEPDQFDIVGTLPT